MSTTASESSVQPEFVMLDEEETSLELSMIEDNF
jgi:hypothetical protein